MIRILAINPGSTSMKLAVYEDEKCVLSESASVDKEESERYMDSMESQCQFRARCIEETLKKANIDPASFDATVGRAGGVGRAKHGAYKVSSEMLAYTESLPKPWHPALFGPMVAKYFADKSGCNAYTYDPTSVDEMLDVARITGLEGVYRSGNGHVLNHRACALRYAEQVGKPLESLRLVTAHLGGGCSFMAFEDGYMRDNCGDLEGTYSPERSGPILPSYLIDYFVNNDLTKQEMSRHLRGKGGFVALLGTDSTIEVEKMMDNGDEKAALVFKGMCYRIAKSIGGLVAAPLKGNVDAIIITGGIAYSKRAVELITEYVRPLAGEIVVYPGEKELEALAMGALRAVRGQEPVHTFDRDYAVGRFSL